MQSLQKSIKKCWWFFHLKNVSYLPKGRRHFFSILYLSICLNINVYFTDFFYILAWLTNDLLATEKKIIIFINLPSLWIKYTLKKRGKKLNYWYSRISNRNGKLEFHNFSSFRRSLGMRSKNRKYSVSPGL